jgi:ABC-type transport system involved in multi-copper enzyme maturation permease subunit
LFDSRSGFWLLAGIGILALLATAAVILFASHDQLTYSTFTSAINIPMTVILPVIAILSVTGEWSQRTGLTTFTLVPHRGQVIAAKAMASVGVAVVTVPLTFGIGALGNLLGGGVAGIDPVWDLTVLDLATIVLANVLSVLFGFMLGVVIRNSVGALVAYLVYQFLLPTLSLILAASQHWFRGLQPWVDFDYAQSALLSGALTTQQWTHLAFTGTVWLIIPMTIGLTLVKKGEVK